MIIVDILVVVLYIEVILLMMCGVMVLIIIDYGDEKEMHQVIIDEQINLIQSKGSDLVLIDIISSIMMNGILY